MSGDLVIEHLQRTLSYVHDEVQPEPNALVFIHFDESADAYVRHSGFLHRFIGRVPAETRDLIVKVCKRAFVTFIPADLVEDVREIGLRHWQDKEIQPSLTAEIVDLWNRSARGYGLGDSMIEEGKEILSDAIRWSFRSGGHQSPFGDLIGVKNNLGGNGPAGEFKEVHGQPIGGLAGARTTEALKDFVTTTLVRN
jgi:hypothetical protein